jgi:hypothetical protein
MYKQIHPIHPETGESLPPQVLRLDTVRNVRPAGGMTMLKTDCDEHPTYVSAEEGEQIAKALLETSATSLAQEVSDLTGAVRALWQLLRNRLH